MDGRADLIFTYGAPYSRQVIGGERQEYATSNLDAQRLLPIRIEQRGQVRLVGVRFRLGGLGPFVREDLRPWTGTTATPSALLGTEAGALEKALQQLGPDEAVPLLDAFFGEKLALDAGRAGFQRALDALERSGGGADVGTLAARSGVSARQLDRWFARQVGIAPKMVGRILRFQQALRALMQDPGCPLAEVAAHAGYFDQAYFIRDFRRMSGGVPRGYRGYYPPDSPTDFAPNEVVFVQVPKAPAVRHRPRFRARTPPEPGAPMPGTGTKADPWTLKTPPGTSDYTLYRDDAAELLICMVGTTKLTYLARALEDLPAMLRAHGDWMPLGAADEQKEAAPGTVEAWGRSESNPVGGWYGLRRGYRGRLAMYIPPLLEELGLVELEHHPKNNRVRAK